MIGTPELVAFSLHWTGTEAGTAADVTSGKLRLWINNVPIWGDAATEGPDVELVDLLEFLSANWNAILLEQAFPSGLEVETPKQLAQFAYISPRTASTGAFAARQMNAFEFFEAHDLSRAFSGFYFPWVIFFRQGTTLWVCSEAAEAVVPLPTAKTVLVQLAEPIVAALERAPEDKRAQNAVTSWSQRARTRAPLQWISYASSLDEQYLVELVPHGQSAATFFELAKPYRDTEPLAVARMIGPGVPPPVARKLITRLKSLQKYPAPQIDVLARRLSKEVRLSPSATPYEQGYELANWFRSTLKLSGDIDLHSILYGWNVRVCKEAFQMASMDAVACWGPNHGPAILINTTGPRSRFKTGIRSSLAHEICHLLVNRRSMLPVAEVLGGRTQLRLEQRADAFAAEVLLPRDEARKALQRAPNIEGAVANLSTRFRVSRHLTALQIMNSGAPLTPREMVFLTRTAHIVGGVAPTGHADSSA